jgi:short-subunit dehydrogenase
MAPPRALKGQLVLVTGAASGIGEATALAFAGRGAKVALVDIDAARLGRVAAVISSRGGGEAPTYVADVASAEHVAELVARVTREHQLVDVLVNNAGVAVVAPFAETRSEDLDWIVGVNVWGALRLTRAWLPGMLARGSGHIVVVASLAGLVGAPGMVAYSTTKFALVGFAESLRLELDGTGVGVTAVCPGYVRTNLSRVTRYGNEGFRRFLDGAPSWYGLSKEHVAGEIVDAVTRCRPLVVLGPEKVGWWLKRLAPETTLAVLEWAARRAGIR